MSKQKKVLFAILIVAVLVRMASAFIMGDRVEELPGIYDQISYHTLATRLIGGYGFTFDQQWWPFTPAGQPTAHWSFLYTFYLTGIYALLGIHPLVARLIQILIAGILMPWFTYHIALRTFASFHIDKTSTKNEWIAVTAAALVGLYPYFIYYAGALMTESYTMVSILWALNVTLSIQAGDNRLRHWIQLGLALGCSLLLRQATSLLIVCILVWLLWTRLQNVARVSATLWKAFRPYLLHSAVTIGILVLMVAPITLYNYQRFGCFVLLNTNAGYAFYWSNHPIHGTKFIPLFTPDMPSYQDLIPLELRSLNEAELEQVLMRRGLRFILQDPKRYLLLSLSRIPEHFKFWPSPDSSLLSNITRVSSIGIALPFMLLGSVLWIIAVVKKRERLEHGLLLQAFAWGYAGIHILSWAGIRYRLPTDAILLIFAAYSISWIWNWTLSKRIFVLK